MYTCLTLRELGEADNYTQLHTHMEYPCITQEVNSGGWKEVIKSHVGVGVEDGVGQISLQSQRWLHLQLYPNDIVVPLT